VSGTTRAGITATGNGALRITGITQAQCTANANLCPYVGIMDFADRENDATQTWRGNGTNENGSASGISGTIYLKSGTMDLRGNGYQMASQIVVDNFTMKGNPSTVTLSYDQSKNYTETHAVTRRPTTAPPTTTGSRDSRRARRTQLFVKKSCSSISPWSSTEATTGAVGAVMS